MPRTSKPTPSTSNSAMSLTEICAPVKKHSGAASESLNPTVRRTRFMLWSTADQAWLADHHLIDDHTSPLCDDVNDALGFSSYDAAILRAQHLKPFLPGVAVRQVRLECDSATYPTGWRLVP